MTATLVAADHDQPEPERGGTGGGSPALPATARVALARRARHRHIDALADREPVDALQQQREREAQLQLDDDRRLVAPVVDVAGDEIAAAHLALDLVAARFEEALDRRVELGFAERRRGRVRMMIASRGTGLAAREIQLDHHVVVVGKEQLVDRRRCDVVFAVFDLLLFELGP